MSTSISVICVTLLMNKSVVHIIYLVFGTNISLLIHVRLQSGSENFQFEFAVKLPFLTSQYSLLQEVLRESGDLML